MAGLAVIAGAIASIARLKQCKSDALEFMGIIVGAILLQPLVFFACYFSLLHSPRHLLETAERLRMTSLQSIYSRTLPIVMATVALCAGFYFVIPDLSVSDRILVIVFIGLASLTVPHMLLDALAAPAQVNGQQAATLAG
jgi:Brp/Blh family beta-carotene 15,15'-monooxygenase